MKCSSKYIFDMKWQVCFKIKSSLRRQDISSHDIDYVE